MDLSVNSLKTTSESHKITFFNAQYKLYLYFGNEKIDKVSLLVSSYLAVPDGKLLSNQLISSIKVPLSCIYDKLD
jgi:hypothetical protein